MNWTVKDILSATGGRLLYGAEERSFQSVGIDSRTIAPSGIFVAIRGENHDAHAFLPQVVESGVKGVVVESERATPEAHADWNSRGVACVEVEDTTCALGAMAGFMRRRVHIPVVAITGSNGKTTTRRMTAAVMAQQYKTLATEGNLNNEIGLPLTLFKLDPTHQAVVVELGINHFGEMDRLAAICKPTVGMITNVGPAHLEFLENLQGVTRAKGELLAHIDAKGRAILNMDDPNVASLASGAGCAVLFFGTAADADVRAEAIVETAAGIAFDLILPDARLGVILKTPGRFMVFNALAAAAAGYVAGVDAGKIKLGLESFDPVSGRLHVVRTSAGVNVIDDTYNANPASMAAALQTFAAREKTGRGFVVLGDMLELGDQAESLHHQVGMLAGEVGADRLYAFGEHAEALLEGASEAGMMRSALFAGLKEEIAADLLQRLACDDWLLVKGSRGMAMETVVRAILEWKGSASVENTNQK